MDWTNHFYSSPSCDEMKVFDSLPHCQLSVANVCSWRLEQDQFHRTALRLPRSVSMSQRNISGTLEWLLTIDLQEKLSRVLYMYTRETLEHIK